MAYVVVHRFEGATIEHYERAQAVLHPADGSLPPGQLVHVGGLADGALVVVAVFDSEDSWRAFRDETLARGLAGLEDGPPAAPVETTFEAHKFQMAAG